VVKVGNPRPSEALSQYANAPRGIAGKKIGLLTTDGVDAKLYKALMKEARTEKAIVEIITPTIGPIQSSNGDEITPHHFLSGAPSCLFDIDVIAPSQENAALLAAEAAAIDFIRDA